MSIMDMLPESETPLPNGYGTGKKAEKGMCLIERTCPQCGKAFTFRMGQTAYRRKVKGKTLRFCSWTCKCEHEREKKTAKRGGWTKTTEERIEDRLEKIGKDRAMLDGEKGKTLPEKERKRLINRLQRLHKEVKELRELKESENRKTDRGGGERRHAAGGCD